MVERIEAFMFRAALVFLFALFAWTLIRSGHVTYVVVAGVVAVAVVATRWLPAPVNAAAAQQVSRARRWGDIVMWPFPVVIIALIALALRLWWALHFDVRLFSDYQQFHELAQRFAAGDAAALGVSKSPATVALYGSIYTLTDRPLLAAHLVGAVLGAIQVVLVYAVATRAFATRTPARFAALAVALFPSAVMSTAYPNSEALFVTVMLLFVWQLLRLFPVLATYSARRLLLAGLLLGAESALLHLTRNTGVVFALWGLAVLLLWARAGTRNTLVFAAAFAVTLALFLTPQVVHNHRTYGAFSIQSSKYAGLNFLAGTNKRFDGRYNDQDLNFIRNRYGMGNEKWNEAMRAARNRARRRIAEDVPGFIGFALTRKFDVMWGEDDYAAVRHPTCMVRNKRIPWRFIANRYYFAVVALAALGVCALAARERAARMMVVVVAGLLGATFLLHLFIEVQPRYHLAMNFIVPVVAAALFARRESPQSLT